MPKKIRELKSDLRGAGWILVPGGKGSHTKWVHESVSRTVILSGNDGSDANPGQVKDIKKAVQEAKKG
jgi:predicted RNA binding protein YcfA (HicA-like mRNA interferase family)